jgi:hypothetical protein
MKMYPFGEQIMLRLKVSGEGSLAKTAFLISASM